MTRFAGAVLAMAMLVPTLCAAQGSAQEEKIWALEQKYWQYVQANDLEHYRAQWKEEFLGWPLNSPEPMRKAHITDWITNRTSKGDSVQSFALDRLVVQVSGNLATTTYRARSTWVDKKGVTSTWAMRILHTWQRNADGTWQILSGMSAPVDAEGK